MDLSVVGEERRVLWVRFANNQRRGVDLDAQ